MKLPSDEQFKPFYFPLNTFNTLMTLEQLMYSWVSTKVLQVLELTLDIWRNKFHCVCIPNRPSLALICFVFFSLNLTLHRLVISLWGAFLPIFCTQLLKTRVAERVLKGEGIESKSEWTNSTNHWKLHLYGFESVTR